MKNKMKEKTTSSITDLFQQVFEIIINITIFRI